MAAFLFDTDLNTDTKVVAGVLQLTGELGHGTFGSVYKCRHQNIDGVVMAVKSSPRCEQHDTLREAELHAKLHHPNICAFFGVARLPNHLLLFVEYIEGQTLTSMIERRKPQILCAAQVIAIFAQVAAGVGYLHRKKILHRDLNPQNIMVCEPMKKIKIIDFGMSRTIGNDGRCDGGHFELRKSVLAPECFGVFERRYGAKSDVFSVGILMCYASTGKWPYEDPPVLNMISYYLLVSEGPVSNEHALVLPAIRQLIASMVAVNPRDRPRLSAVMEALDCINHVHGFHAAVPGGWPENPKAVISRERSADGQLDQPTVNELATKKKIPSADLTAKLGRNGVERVEYNYFLNN